MSRGTLALSWGPWGGFYVTRSRICLGYVAFTLLRNYEIDDLMEGYLDHRDLLSACKQWRHATQQRLRHLDSRNEAVPLPVDQALFEAIIRAEAKS